MTGGLFAVPSMGLLVTGRGIDVHTWSEERQQSRIRIAETKGIIIKAVMEHKPDGLTEMEMAIACHEQAAWWMQEAWKTDIADGVSNASLEARAITTNNG